MTARAATRRQVLRGAAALGAGTLATGFDARAAAARARDGRRPNVVVILADDLGYGSLGAYGQQVLRTPQLDRMAGEGIAFTDVYAGAPICAPSRCSLLTGKHTGHATVRDNSFTATGIEPELATDDVTWAQVLKQSGYTTGAFGKWGFGPDDCYQPMGVGVGPVGTGGGTPGGPVGDLSQNVGHHSHPLQKGFDEFVGMVRHHHATEGYFPNYLWHGNERVLYPENADDARATYAPDVYVSEALRFMRRNQHRPFALYLSLQLVHWPNLVPSTDPYSGMPWTEEMKRYAAMYTRMDTYVGMVRQQLERLGLDDNTVVLFTSDNGTTEERAAVGSGESSRQLRPAPDSAAADELWNISGGLRAGKHSLYEGGIRVPMVVWGPGVVRRDGGMAEVRQPWAGWDLLPTLADFAGARDIDGIDGISVRPLITGEGTVNHAPLYWERPPYPGLNIDGTPPASATFTQAARLGQWKGQRWTVGNTDPHTPDDQWRFELYDLAADRGETTDVSALHPEMRREMETVMKAGHEDPAS